MLDSGMYHQFDITDRDVLMYLIDYSDDEQVLTYARLLINPLTVIQPARAKLFDALLAIDQRVYFNRRWLKDVINPYNN